MQTIKPLCYQCRESYPHGHPDAHKWHTQPCTDCNKPICICHMWYYWGDRCCTACAIKRGATATMFGPI